MCDPHTALRLLLDAPELTGERAPRQTVPLLHPPAPPTLGGNLHASSLSKDLDSERKLSVPRPSAECRTHTPAASPVVWKMTEPGDSQGEDRWILQGGLVTLPFDPDGPPDPAWLPGAPSAP